MLFATYALLATLATLLMSVGCWIPAVIVLLGALGIAARCVWFLWFSPNGERWGRSHGGGGHTA